MHAYCMRGKIVSVIARIVASVFPERHDKCSFLIGEHTTGCKYGQMKSNEWLCKRTAAFFKCSPGPSRFRDTQPLSERAQLCCAVLLIREGWEQ
jgi:hypothetical protein